MTNNPTVSILCPTYNHAKYIKTALDSFLSQETNFEFEILIHDDASTDGTQEIIEDYISKHPGKIRAILRSENLYSKGVRGVVSNYLLPIAKGRYTATCEGDDYWIDNKKLQKQVDFMDKHPDYAVCFHPVRVVFENGEQPTRIFPDKKTDFDIGKLLRGNFIQTNSVMYRKQNYKDIVLGMIPGDWYLHIYHAQFGKIGFIDEVMSVYRKNKSGIWWDKEKVWREYGEAHLEFYTELLQMFGSNKVHKHIILNNVAIAFEKMAQYNALNQRIISKYPDFVMFALSELVKAKTNASDAKKHRDKLKLENTRLLQELNRLGNPKELKVGATLLTPARKARNVMRKLRGR